MASGHSQPARRSCEPGAGAVPPAGRRLTAGGGRRGKRRGHRSQRKTACGWESGWQVGLGAVRVADRQRRLTLSPRLRETLESADIIAAEDTRRLRRLAADLGITLTPGMLSRTTRAMSGAGFLSWSNGCSQRAGRRLITDAGMPAISDPGYRLVRAAAEAGLPVRAVPGPSAVTTALALSGLPSDRWVFEGFLPRGGGERRSRLADAGLGTPHRSSSWSRPRRADKTAGRAGRGASGRSRSRRSAGS